MDVDELRTRLMQGERRALARAITLVESGRADHRARAVELLESLPVDRQAIRVALSGTPGVGKSTFIESFGSMLTGQGMRVAVLAIDPSSARTGGSILGDKTRMDQLARDPKAFIRPSPSQTHLGGVGRRTREAVSLCEAAGYDVVLIETVGVGQSETVAAQLSDIFALLLAPAGGDELQGVKRGIMEIADLILVNKADGELKSAATRTCADYSGALRPLIFVNGSLNERVGRTQDWKESYLLNGCVVYAVDVNSFLKEKKLLTAATKGVVMPKWRSVDLDEIEDWVMAEIFHKNFDQINEQMQILMKEKDQS